MLVFGKLRSLVIAINSDVSLQPHLNTASSTSDIQTSLHPFEQRNIHDKIAKASRKRFDNELYADATEAALNLLEKEVKKIGGKRLRGFNLMMTEFDRTKSNFTKLNPLQNEDEENEQDGYKHIFAGAQQGIRNPRAHNHEWPEEKEECLNHLSLASMLLHKLDARPDETS